MWPIVALIGVLVPLILFGVLVERPKLTPLERYQLCQSLLTTNQFESGQVSTARWEAVLSENCYGFEGEYLNRFAQQKGYWDWSEMESRFRFENKTLSWPPGWQQPPSQWCMVERKLGTRTMQVISRC